MFFHKTKTKIIPTFIWHFLSIEGFIMFWQNYRKHVAFDEAEGPGGGGRTVNMMRWGQPARIMMSWGGAKFFLKKKGELPLSTTGIWNHTGQDKMSWCWVRAPPLVVLHLHGPLSANNNLNWVISDDVVFLDTYKIIVYTIIDIIVSTFEIGPGRCNYTGLKVPLLS